ncbi:MAG TPA: D-alanine--D-alanine ligase [Phycisphaerales bacterium]|nr:D-alanine--D-alanine ligase [Phycisphaerales bacterium]HMP37176.1 D-alanine--D-alanine ligase [Phycisphaerales bacterium]
MPPLRVLVLFGGPDAERPVSIESGRAVAAALRDLGAWEVDALEIDLIDAASLLEREPSVVFPVLHGPWGEGGPLQEILEATGIPYVGSGPRAARLAMDKCATKLLASGAGIPTPAARELSPGAPCDLAPPLVIKPVDDGSSVDLRICRTAEEVATARRELEGRRPRLLAERYVEGREITAPVVHGSSMPLIEIRAASGLYDYDAKYLRDDTTYLVAPELAPGLRERIEGLALAVYQRLGCRDLARVDFMLDAEGPWLLEVNTMPGFTGHSLVPMAAQHAGIAMPQLCAMLVEAALRRGPGRGRARGDGLDGAEPSRTSHRPSAGVAGD